MSGAVEIPALPGPLRWLQQPEHWEHTGDAGLVVRAGRRTDLFTDPGGEYGTASAPALVAVAGGDLMFSARVRADLAATFDAAALLVRVDERTWAKLCVELSPQGEPTVVSVVTRGASDDCNSFPVRPVPVSGEDGVWLRVSRLGPAFAFHARAAGDPWRLVRYFALAVPGDGEPEYGFLAQSPTGEGCTARFDDITHVPERLADLRDGT